MTTAKTRTTMHEPKTVDSLTALQSILGAIVAIFALSFGGGCNSEGFCVDCTDAAGTGIFDGGGTEGDADLSDGGIPSDACVSSGIEQCDELDNDCDGLIDEGELPGVGSECGTDMGECEFGTTVCEEGEVVCAGNLVAPDFELCNNLDDDCDGNSDENNPQGGLVCGTNAGECQAGVQECQNGSLLCVGEVIAMNETCNGFDDDCDGNFDEGITLSGDCGPTSDTGLCTFGTQTCVGGQIQCVGAVFESIEQCDALDHDCNGLPTNGYSLTSDPNNCVTCGTVCAEPNAFMACNNGCVIAACETGFIDRNGIVGDGCEVECTFQGNEICNGQDDDCDGDIDEDVVSPIVCDQDGACAGTVPVCNSAASEFQCNYAGNVSLDGNGNIVPEEDCDEIDNDCDGNVDESFPTKGAVCDDGELGQCRDLGAIVCNASDDGVLCTAVDDDGAPPAEICNNSDDDCDGNVDEGDLQNWVDIGGYEIFQYEASRPDSTFIAPGFASLDSVCSQAGRMPWTNVTQPEAEAACTRIGARLCTEAEWQLSCETDNLPPATTQQGSNNIIRFEAEDATLYTQVPGLDNNSDPINWTLETTRAGFSGTGSMWVEDGETPDYFNQADLTDSPRLDYTLNFNTTGTHYLWIRMLSDESADDSFFVAFNDTDGNLTPGNAYVDSDEHDSWLWFGSYNDEVARISFNVPSVGAHTLSVYLAENGVRVDRFLVTTNIDFVPVGNEDADQCQWSYDSDCGTYQPNTCNAEDYDGDAGTAGDQDIALATGSLAACFADWEAAGDVYDLSGNIKEWTAERAANVNPIRGGSFNNTAIGTSCQFDFLTADDSFFLPNIGFRCCR